MKKLLNKDSYWVGIIATLVSELLCAALLLLVLFIIQYPIHEHIRWFVVTFVPALLLLRYYAKSKQYPTTLRSVIITFFVTFVLFMWCLLKFKYVTFS